MYFSRFIYHYFSTPFPTPLQVKHVLFLNPLIPLSAACMYMGKRLPTGVWVAPQGPAKSWLALPQVTISCQQLLGQEQDFMSPSPTNAWIWTGLILCLSMVCSHSQCEVVCVTALPCPVNTVLWQIDTYDLIICPPSVMNFEPWVKEMWHGNPI